MSDSKISALPAATTPLAGTEVLPIVQGGATVKVANNDLRPKQIQSNATSGVLQVTGPSAAATRVMTTPDANFTAARTDAAQSFTGNQTLSTGNLVIGTAGKGIDFSADNPDLIGMTSELLDDYEEGLHTVTVTTGAGSVTLNSTYNKLQYTKVGRTVTVSGTLSVSSVAAPSGFTKISLPFACATLSPVTAGRGIGFASGYLIGTLAQPFSLDVSEGSTQATLTYMSGGSAAWVAASSFVAGSELYISMTYTV